MNVHGHRVADVGHSRPIDVGQRSQTVIEDPGFGFGHSHHVTVDHHAHRHSGTLAHLTHRRAGQDRFDLTGGVAHHTNGNPALMKSSQRGHALVQHVAPQVGAARTIEGDGRLLDVVFGNPHAPHVGLVVDVPVPFVGSGRRLGRHSPVVGPVIRRQVRSRSVEGEQRGQHRRVGDDEDATGVEQHRVDGSRVDDQRTGKHGAQG